MDVIKSQQISSRPIDKVVVHPPVLLSIVDHYNRVARDTNRRVVGVLLGTSVKGTVDVTNSYAAPFEEDDKDSSIWFLDHNYHESMFSMFRRTNAKEHVVGWYSTGPKLQENDLNVHGLFSDYVSNPVLVIIDVQPRELGIPTKAYCAVEEVKENATQKSQQVFVHVPSEIAAHEVEEIGVEHLLRDVKDTTISTLATEVTGKLAALKGLQWRSSAMAATVLQFPQSASTNRTAKIHPLVIFNICDCYVRRPDGAERVIGTLLGSVLPDGTVDIRNSYAVPHNESFDQVALDIDYHLNMLASQQKVNPREAVVGWFSTGAGVTGGSALIHDFYAREVPIPVHLTVDTAFTDEKQTIKAFVSNSLFIGDHQLAAQFQEIPLDTRMVEAECVGFDILKTTMVDRLPGDMEGMEATMERLLSLIDDVSKYFDDVVEGRVAPDNNIGRFISDTVASLPKFSPQVFNKLVNDSFQDHSLVLYLSSIARTQLSLAHSLNSAAQTM